MSTVIKHRCDENAAGPRRRRAAPAAATGRCAPSRSPEPPRARRRAAPRPSRRALAARARPSGRRGRRSAARALRKRKSSARRVGRAPLAPHRAPGARAVRLICFSGGRTRPATICQPSFFLRRCQEGQAMARHVSSSSSWIRRVSVVHSTRHERTLRAPRSRSHCSCRPHLSACAESVGGYAGRDAQAERELREGAARPRRDRAGVFVRRRARCRRGAA